MKQELRAAIRSILSIPHLALLGTTMALTTTVSFRAEAELPLACSSGMCGGERGPGTLDLTGSTTTRVIGNTMFVDQTSDRAVLNWQSFNVSADGRVVFNQPNSSSIALNRIFQQDASRILGAVEANGQVYLINPNGFVFGRTARIDAAGILASSLQISPDTFTKGLLAPELMKNKQAALEGDGRTHYFDKDGKAVEIKVLVEEGAQLRSHEPGGRVMLASRVIDNSGTIASPDGQVILAAGERVYLQANNTPELRGLLVEVDAGGEAWNRFQGDISAAHGNVTIAGLAVNQQGRISASTTVSANGSVRLLARDTPRFDNAADSYTLGAGQNGGRLELGQGSSIEIRPDKADTTTAVDDQQQLASRIELSARQVFLRSGSQIIAPAGNLSVTAAANPAQSTAYDASARIRVEAGAQIDLSGSDVSLDMSRNQLTVELRANELRDSPAQRNGVLRGQTVVVDARVGTRIANIKDALDAVKKNVEERTTQGGTATFNSEGDIVVAEGARIDVSGGVVNYKDGPIRTTLLIGADGKLDDIGTADPLRTYIGFINPVFRRADDRWGFVDLIDAPGIPLMQPGFVAGRDAGTIQFAAPSMVMHGTLHGETVVGPYQRQQGRQPQGGQLIVGLPDGRGQVTPDFRVPSIRFSRDPALISAGDDATLPPQREVALPVDYLSRGFTRTQIFSNGRITVPEDVSLQLTGGSSLAMTGHQVDIQGNIGSAGGSISATSVLTAGTGVPLGRAAVSIGERTTLDVRGNWTNDALTARTDPFGRPSTSVLADGGSIALSLRADNAELVIGDQVQLLANGGAWLRQDGTLKGGAGGSIKIDASGLNSALDVGKSVTLQAFGAVGAEGGKFTLAAPRIEVNSGKFWSAGQRLDSLPPATPEEQEAASKLAQEYFSVGSSLFTDHGFGSVSLIAEGTVDRNKDRDGLRIATNIEARARTLQVNEGNAEIGSSANIASLSNVSLLDESSRRAMQLSFTVNPVQASSPEQVGVLNLRAGAVIHADPGSSVAFASSGRIDLDGSIVAHGGSISALVSNPKDGQDKGYLADVGVRLGSQARLDVSGRAVYQPVADGALTGTLYNGGSVTLQTNRGSVVADPGALVNVSGTSAALDHVSSSDGRITREIIGTNAGVLSLIAPEAIAFNGELRANAGVGQTGPALGGELVMRLSRGRGWSPGQSSNPNAFPTNPRVLRVTAEDIALGGEPPSGIAVLRTQTLANSGIDALTLEADGRIEFDSTQLSLGRRIVLDSPEIAARNDAIVALNAPYLSLGNASATRVATETPATGKGSLSFTGSFIEAIGAVSLSGASRTTLASTGDLRLRQYQDATGTVGHLRSAGDVTLRATQIYPATKTAYSISALGDDATLRIESSGTPGAVPLSAGGKLTLNAANIEQRGTVLAPFGAIDMNASKSLTLAAGSRTSVSGAGSRVPFGRVDNGQWNYIAFDTQVQNAIPERRIGLSAPAISQDKSATLDLSGGGDLYAYEWVPGTGGSKDALAGNAQAGRYAILPSLRGQFAPYDPQEYADSNLAPGESVYLSGIAGLEPGFYPLLPARYALLPGAMLIESVANTTDIRPGSPSVLADGTPVIAGYRSFGTTGLGSSRYTGFSVRPGSEARQLAKYEDSLASKYFADRATRADLPRPNLPVDAGALSLSATTSLDMQGIVKIAAADGGRAGRIEVAAPNLEIVGANGGTGQGLRLSADILNSWKPGELWLGGTRRTDQVDVVSDRVRIGEGVNLSADEIVLLANGNIEIASGANVSSSSAGRDAPVDRKALRDTKLKLSGDDAGAAIVAVSDRNLYEMVRDGVDPETGSVLAASGSLLSTRGALLVNAPHGAELDGDFRARGAVWTLGANTVRFDENVRADGLNISSGLQARLQDAGVLRIDSDVMEFVNALSLGATHPVDELQLRAGTFRNLSGGDITLAAKKVTLAGTTAGSSAAPAAGTGVLSVQADVINLGEGKFSIDSFARTALNGDTEIRGVGKTDMRVGGDLDLIAGRVAAASGGHTHITAEQGTVRIAQSKRKASTDITGVLGGALSIKANKIEHTGTLFAPSGLVELVAVTNANTSPSSLANLTIADTGVIDVAGRTVTAVGRNVSSVGGTVRLASEGALTTAEGSRIDVTGGADANSGRLSMHAGGLATLNGTLLGRQNGGALGGSFDLYAGTLANASQLIDQLQVAGFTEKQSLHVASGNLELAAGKTVDARTIEWTADSGRVQVDGAMLAQSSLGARSSIRLYGSEVGIGSTASLNASAVAGGRSGNDIELGSSTGMVSIGSGSSITASTLRLRAPALNNDVAIQPGGLLNVDSIVVEPVRSYDVPEFTGSADYDAIRNDIATYMAGAAPQIRTRFGNDSRVRVEAGVELRRQGDLNLDALNLASWRFDSSPVAFSVRATGSINVNGTIGDGFGRTGLRTTLLDGESATLRFAAGADLLSANPNAVVRGGEADLNLAPSALIRTGTGDLRVTAARDVIFGANSSIYTGGIAAIPSQNGASASAIFTFPNRGGNVAITAGRDVVGAEVTQIADEWLRRQGTPDGISPTRLTRWGIDFGTFRWNAGTLGGGDLSILAGNDINSLSATAADTGAELVDNVITRYGGGSLSLQAGRDVNSAMLYLARGDGRVVADGQLGVSRFGETGERLGSLMMLGDARMSVVARGDIAMEKVFNPTLTTPQNVNTLQNSSFFTYSERSAIDIRSQGGNVELNAAPGRRLINYLGRDNIAPNEAALKIAPASLSMMSLVGDVTVLEGNIALFPSNTGQLDIFAARDFKTPDGAVIAMSDLSAGELPTPEHPSRQPGALLERLMISHAASARHIDDRQPVLITAGRDIVGQNIQVAKSARMTAGRDIVDTVFKAQNLHDSDVTLVSAGRDLTYAPSLVVAEMSVGGPGHFDVITGRNLDLGFSGGLTTTGRLVNPAIQSDVGADLNVMVGMAKDMDAAGFVNNIVASSSALRERLVKFMVARNKETLDFSGASSKFLALDPAAQRPLLLEIFNAELVASGREADKSRSFARGYNAIDALFPGSRSQNNPYDGDLTMAFSRIYTLAGGNVSIAVPGGLMNVGLANPPPSVQTRPPSALGIVAQRTGDVRIFTEDDVLVNQSRVFTLLGGDISIWSTIGDIDAGRGAKSSVSAPPPSVLVDSAGRVTLDFAGAVAGSGIRTIRTDTKVKPGNVDLIAPIGTIDSGDAGIGASGDVHVIAERVLGGTNFDVGGVSTGIPAETSGLGASLAGVSAVASSSSSASSSAVDTDRGVPQAQPSLAQAALSWLEVFVVGLGEDSGNVGKSEPKQ